jgi:hypothetical protein
MALRITATGIVMLALPRYAEVMNFLPSDDEEEPQSDHSTGPGLFPPGCGGEGMLVSTCTLMEADPISLCGHAMPRGGRPLTPSRRACNPNKCRSRPATR